MDTIITTETQLIDGRRTGKGPARGHIKMLNTANYLTPGEVPPAFTPWAKRVKFPLRSFGNIQKGDCTRASQAIFQMRMERDEQRRTVDITDDEVLRVYFEMTARLYGGGDTGAYELDALNEWRRPETTFKDTKGRPFTIDAFTKVNQSNLQEVKQAIYLSQAHGVKFCMNLPLAFAYMTTARWDLPAGKTLTGDWAPGSWGGHSMTATGYTADGIIWPTTWNEPDGLITWAAFAAYCDEAYLVIDSLDAWRKKPGVSKLIDLTGLKNDVNAVSSYPISSKNV
jgi:hypothetical protein